MPKVLITAASLAGREGEFSRILRNAGLEIVYPPMVRQLVEDEILEHLRGVSATLAGSEPYSRRVLEANPQLRVIARMGVGYDAVDVECATERNIPVCIVPGTNQDAVAEHGFALILALAKYVVVQDKETRAGIWPRGVTIPLRGRTLGIAGLGRIGKAMAFRALAFKMPVIAFESYPDMDFVSEHGIRLVSWEELLAESDYLSLHLPLTRDSRHIINRRTLAIMKPTAFLINTARGALVNEVDLLHALESGQIAGAGLDVFEEEPPTIGPLFHLPNVVVTPHAAGVDLQSREDMAASAAQAIASIYQGDWPAEKIVNPGTRSGFRW